MSERFKVPRGTFDVLPEDSAVRAGLNEAATEAFARAGYGRIETPAFEDTELFARGVGGSTDIVRKEMFTFSDQGDRGLTLRPEGTAPICRAYLEHGMQKLPQPVKLWYWGPYFRHERPQAGRYRQFHQIGAEVIGSASPLVDAELIVLLNDLLHDLSVPSLGLRIGSLGSLGGRAAYREELQSYLREHESELSDDVRERIDENPLRAFDSKDEGTRAVMARAPMMLDHLTSEDAEHFAEVQGAAEERRGPLPGGRIARPRPRLLHAHGLLIRVRPARRPVGGRRRRALRRADRAARRRRDARGGVGLRDRARAPGPRPKGRQPPGRGLRRGARRAARQRAGAGAGASPRGHRRRPRPRPSAASRAR